MQNSLPNTPAQGREFRLPRPMTALGLLGCLFLFCLVVAGVLLPFLPRLVSRPEAAVRIAAVIQDLLIFILPAVGTAMVVTRLPARLLAVDTFPRWKSVLTALVILICSVPAMNWIIEWNKNWHLPESMAGAEMFFRQLEEGANATVELLMTGASILSLIVSVLIVGVLAGFSEELFFRGALQRILGMSRMNKHLAIWLVAFIFSAFHFQLFGFVPRMLLGAFLGYLLWWSGSLWLPVIVHIFNNTMVVIAAYCSANSSDPAGNPVESLGAAPASASEILLVVGSFAVTAAGIWFFRRHICLPAK